MVSVLHFNCFLRPASLYYLVKCSKQHPGKWPLLDPPEIHTKRRLSYSRRYFRMLYAADVTDILIGIAFKGIAMTIPREQQMYGYGIRVDLSFKQTAPCFRTNTDSEGPDQDRHCPQTKSLGTTDRLRGE